MQRERPISFQGTTPGDSEESVTHEFDEDGVITGALVSTHVGQEYALENYAELIQNGSTINLWEPLDNEFLAGNGRDYDLRIRFEFEEGDKLRLKTKNTNQNGNIYHHSMMIRVDYETSMLDRIVAALKGAI